MEFPYLNSISMIILLPDQSDKMVELFSQLNETKLTNAINSLESTRINQISIPKFKIEQEYDLHKVLPMMGMIKVFTDQANLSGLGVGPVKVRTSIHKAVIEVDEKGTTAAAATTVQVVPCCLLYYGIEFILDRPFAFLIRDKNLSINLFAGIINIL